MLRRPLRRQIVCILTTVLIPFISQAQHPDNKIYIIDRANNNSTTYVYSASAYAMGQFTYSEYLFYIRAANDTFYGCLVERFGDQGLVTPGTRVNVGEVAQPIIVATLFRTRAD